MNAERKTALLRLSRLATKMAQTGKATEDDIAQMTEDALALIEDGDVPVNLHISSSLANITVTNQKTWRQQGGAPVEAKGSEP